MSMARRSSKTLWAVVLAAGDGTRLAPLTRRLYGYPLAKQFAVLAGEKSLLQSTLARIAPLVPPERTVVVAGRKHEALVMEQLRDFSGVKLVLQPRNAGTGPGILLPLSWILANDPDASVAVLPCDHYMCNPEPFLSAVEEVARSAGNVPTRITLLADVPEGPETDYGWIVPGRQIAGHGEKERFLIRRFVEKPGREAARRLFAQGALWNTFISVGGATAYWELAVTHLPQHAGLFVRYIASLRDGEDDDLLATIYADMASADFSRAVLEHAKGLAVVPIRGWGWSDLGSPDRVWQSFMVPHEWDDDVVLRHKPLSEKTSCHTHSQSESCRPGLPRYGHHRAGGIQRQVSGDPRASDSVRCEGTSPA